MSLLNKGITSAPTSHPNPFILFKDLNKFIRDLTVKRYYHIKSLQNEPSKELPIRPPPLDDVDFTTVMDLEELYLESHSDDLEWLCPNTALLVLQCNIQI